MIELRYNKDGKLEYRTAIAVDPHNTLYANSYAGELQWDEWKIVPSVEKATESSASRGLHTERVTLEITHDGTESVATQKFWDRVLKPDPWFGEHVKVVSEWDQIRESGDRVSREEGIITLTEEVEALNKEIDRLTADRDAAIRERDQEISVLKARVDYLESAPAASGNCQGFLDGSPPAGGWLTDDERRLIERLKESAEAFPLSMHYYENITVREALVMFDALLAREEGTKTLTEEISAQNKVIEELKKELDEIKNSSTPTITKEDIDQLSCIADRLDYAQFYESANSLRSFIARNK